MSKMSDRIGKMLLQVEGEREAGNDKAADNMMEQVMRLSQAANIDLTLARAEQVKKHKAEMPEKRDFKVGEIGRAANKNAHFADLMIAICEANDVEVTISGSRAFVFGFGMPSDLDMCERFFALLAPQMVQEADAGLKKGDNGEWRDDVQKTRRVEIDEDDRDWGGRKAWVNHNGEAAYYDERDEELKEVDGKMRRSRMNGTTGWFEWVESRPPPKYKNEPVFDDEGNPVMERKWVSLEDGRSWRNNFYQGFINRARYRLREAKRSALREAGIDVQDDSDNRAIALRDKEKEVRDYFEEENRVVLATGSTYGGAKLNRHSHIGQTAGDAAGQRATLGNERDLS